MRWFVTAWITEGVDIWAFKLEIPVEISKIKEVHHSGHYKENYDYVYSLGRKEVKKRMGLSKAAICSCYKLTIWKTAQMGNYIPMEKPQETC